MTTTTNKGDAGYWYGIKGIKDLSGNLVIPRRELYTTRRGMKNVVFPGHESHEGDIVPQDGKDYCYFWWKEGTDEMALEELGELRMKGYDFALTPKANGNFKLVWPGWRENEAGRIYDGVRVLLAVPFETWLKNQEEDAEFRRQISRLEEKIDQNFEETIRRTAREEGIAVEPLPAVKGRK